MLPFEPITRLRAGRVIDEMSGTESASDWGNPDKAELRALFAPGNSDDLPGVDLDAISDLATLYLDRDADIKADDRVEARGDLWRVLGTPARWGLPGHGATGCVVDLKRI